MKSTTFMFAILILAALTLLFKPPTAQASSPNIYHAPRGDAEAGIPLRLNVEVQQDWEFEAFWIAWRPLGSKSPYIRQEFERTEQLVFSVVLDDSVLQPPGFEYYIASKDTDGKERLHFASARQPHPVIVLGETEQSKRQARLERHNGNRSQFTAFGQYSAFGSREADITERSSGGETGTFVTDTNSDFFGTFGLEYRYRLLSNVYDFSFGVARMRGEHATVNLQDGEELRINDGDSNSPGMDYGWGAVTFELHEYFSTEAKVIFGASEQGFAAGVGGLLRVGRIAGTNLEVGGELVQHIGHHAFFRFSWDTIPYVPMALTIDLTQRPDGEGNPMGRRLIYDLGVEVTEDLTLIGQIGTASRNLAVDGGVMGGAKVKYSF